MASETGQRVGDYEILSPLGAGGMGRVYKVRNVISNREEAMKILLPDFAAQPELAARFLAEIRTLGGLEHPNIAQLRTAFQVQNHFVMVMEYVEGATLEKLASEGRIPIDKVIDYASQTLAGLSYAHGHGVTHRDIKPANIMITGHGVAKLMDFGIAKTTDDAQLTRPGTTMGSVYYMSPEQVQGGPIDARSDIYSFGVTLYEMFTGKKPFVSESSYTVLNAQINEAPVPLVQVDPTVPLALNNIVLKAMEKNPAARFQSAEEFRNALRSLRQPQAEPVAASAPVPAASPVPAPVSASVSAQSAAPATAFSATAVGAGAGFATQAAQASAAPAPEAQFAPVPQVPAAAARPAKSHRGLWIVMGAVAAVLAIVAVATIVPRFSPMLAGHISAKAQPTPQPNPTASGSASSAPATPAEGASGAVQPVSQPASAPAAFSTSAISHQSGSQPGSTTRQPYVPSPASEPSATTTAASAIPVPAGPPSDQVRQVRDRLMNLSARAEAAQTGVQSIRTQQQAQGLDIRGDVLALMSRMNADLSEAQRTLDQKDLATANDYIERADREVSKLETFLGK